MTPAEFDAHLWHYNAMPDRVIDGDTFMADVDLGLSCSRRLPIRALGYDAPEVHGPTQAEGLAAREYLCQLLMPCWAVRLVTEKDAQSFERYLARVYVEQDGRLVDLAEIMIAAGHGRPR